MSGPHTTSAFWAQVAKDDTTVAAKAQADLFRQARQHDQERAK